MKIIAKPKQAASKRSTDRKEQACSDGNWQGSSFGAQRPTILKSHPLVRTADVVERGGINKGDELEMRNACDAFFAARGIKSFWKFDVFSKKRGPHARQLH